MLIPVISRSTKSGETRFFRVPLRDDKLRSTGSHCLFFFIAIEKYRDARFFLYLTNVLRRIAKKKKKNKKWRMLLDRFFPQKMFVIFHIFVIVIRNLLGR